MHKSHRKIKQRTKNSNTTTNVHEDNINTHEIIYDDPDDNSTPTAYRSTICAVPSRSQKFIASLWFILIIFYLEVAMSLACFQSVSSMPYILVTSIALGLILVPITTTKHTKLNQILSSVIVFLLTFAYVSEMIYYKIFGTFFTLASLTMANDAAQYKDILFKFLTSNWYIVLLMFIPFLFTFLKGKLTEQCRLRFSILYGIGGLLSYIILITLFANGYFMSSYDANVYNNSYLPSTSIQTFGGVISLQSDIMQLLGYKNTSALDSLMLPSSTTDDVESESEMTVSNELTIEYDDNEDIANSDTELKDEPIQYDAQILDIDFETLAANESDETLQTLHTYFATADTQDQNEYTGMFEGQNLIFITAESFSHYCIDEELTPTLYKLYSEGFQFTDFYTPGWSVSTTDGEYVAMTGLIPKSGVRSFTESADNYLPFTMGLQTTGYGYEPIMAYHNHTYDYYSRDLSHPNMGYEYKALGLGLDITPTWPESDLEMMELSVEDYINSDELFHAYYMTVSGHQLYTFIGNSMSAKNKEATDDLDYSEAVRAYLSANIELDLALEYLLNALEEAGKLDNTVIVLSADHYPYGLTVDELTEMNGEPVDETYGIYQNALLIWSGSMEEPIVVDKPAQSLDIIPTISNLMGFDYDSRLLMGNDILGDDYEPLIIFSNRSFITEEGFYNASTQVFTENEGVEEVNDEYIQEKSALVDLKFELSELILDYDYYSTLGLDSN